MPTGAWQCQAMIPTPEAMCPAGSKGEDGEYCHQWYTAEGARGLCNEGRHLEAAMGVGGVPRCEGVLVRQQGLHRDEGLDDDVLHAIPQHRAAVTCTHEPHAWLHLTELSRG